MAHTGCTIHALHRKLNGIRCFGVHANLKKIFNFLYYEPYPRVKVNDFQKECGLQGKEDRATCKCLCFFILNWYYLCCGVGYSLAFKGRVYKLRCADSF